MIKWLVLFLLYSPISYSALAPHVMDRLALQIPGVSTGTTTPAQMREAWRRYEAIVDMFIVESNKYRMACYKALFEYEKSKGTELFLLHGASPNDVCNYLAKIGICGQIVTICDEQTNKHRQTK